MEAAANAEADAKVFLMNLRLLDCIIRQNVDWVIANIHKINTIDRQQKYSDDNCCVNDQSILVRKKAIRKPPTVISPAKLCVS